MAVSCGRSGAWVMLAFVVSCGGAHERGPAPANPSEPAAPPASGPLQPTVAPGASVTGPLSPLSRSTPPSSGSPVAVAPAAPGGARHSPPQPELPVADPVPDHPPLAPVARGFGRVAKMDVRVPLWSLPRTPPRSAAPAKYEAWHEKKRETLGYGYLSIVDLSDDERYALVVSEDEALLHTYEFPSFKKVGAFPVPGYKQFARGDFLFAPWSVSPGSPPDVLFAGETGVFALSGATGSALPLFAEPADELRFTDDHAVLGASSAYIPAQQSRIVFYGFRGSRLEPLMTLDFAERVEEWDLDSEKRRLAVTYYPSNDTEVLDLATRQVLWVSGAPQYSNSVDISPDDTRLAVGGSALVVHDFHSGMPLTGDASFGNNIHRVRFSPSGDAIAVSSYEGKIRIFDATRYDGKMRLRKLLRHTGTANVYALRFIKDGSMLVSGSGDQTVRVWGQ